MSRVRTLERGRIADGALLAFVVALAALGGPSCARRAAEPAPWKVVEVPTDADFVGAWFSDSLNGWLTGGGWAIDGGIVGRTRDGGRSWRFQSGIVDGGSGFGIGSVQFRDSLHGCAVAGHGIVLLTEDGGESWRTARHASTRRAPLTDVHFIDGWNGWALGAGLVRTEDGGETWNLVLRSESENGYFSGNAIHFVDEARGWLVGHAGSVMTTRDGGRSWSPVSLPLWPDERPTLWDVTFVGDARGWIVGEQGAIFHTRDGGAVWTRQENGVPAVRTIPKGERRRREIVPELETEPDRLALSAVQFADTSRGWAVGYYADVAESVVLGTTDGGATWQAEHVQRGELLRSLYVLDAGHAWTSGDRARAAPQVVLRYAPREP
jgi:photosystem II stability/assembly factor-like uncharacterized protein